MSEENQVSRRELLRNLGISAALATSGAGLVSAQVAQHVHDAVSQEKSAANKGEYAPKCFTAHEFKTLRRLSDLIIPADDHSAGALEAGAAEWIDYMASNSAELAEIFTGGFGWLDHHMQQQHGADFIDAKPDEQTAVLDVIAFKKNETPENAAGVRFFAFLDVGHELQVDERPPPFQAGHGLVIGLHEHVGGFLQTQDSGNGFVDPAIDQVQGFKQMGFLHCDFLSF